MSRRQRKQNPVRAAAVTAAKGASWMSLLAVTSLGAGADARRTVIQAGEPLGDDSGDLRLIVQSYSPDSLTEEHLPRSGARPRSSIQRAVTSEELAQGVNVSMVDLEREGADASIVVAWIEKGPPDLEYDALTARPSKGSYLGIATHAEGARVVLSRG